MNNLDFPVTRPKFNNEWSLKHLGRIKSGDLQTSCCRVLCKSYCQLGFRRQCGAVQSRKAMDAFSSSSSSPSSGSQQFSADDFKDQLKTQLAQAYAEEFLETIRGKCFEKCITKPGSSLSGGESSCISRCVERYIEATGIISKSLFSTPH